AGRFPKQADDLKLYRSIATMDKKAPLPKIAAQTPTWQKAAALASKWQLTQLAGRLEEMARKPLPSGPSGERPTKTQRLSWRRQSEARCLRARCAADLIASGVNSSRDSTTSAASASASGSGGYSRLGLAITTIPAAAAARRPFVESSTAAASAGSTPSRRGRVRYTPGAGSPGAPSSPETVIAKQSVIPARSSTASITGRFDDDASPSGQRSASRLTAATAPGNSGRRRRY